MKIKMSVADALEFLEIASSSQDPVIYRCEEIYACELEGAEIVAGDPTRFPASRLKIRFWKSGKTRSVKGSLYSMVVDRLGDYFRSIK